MSKLPKKYLDMFQELKDISEKQSENLPLSVEKIDTMIQKFENKFAYLSEADKAQLLSESSKLQNLINQFK